jgi:PBP1b-binding outer membrane lipoprotein LpoB
MKRKKLMLAEEIVQKLENEGIDLTTNAVRNRMRNSFQLLANDMCQAMGIEADEDKIESFSSSRSFQEALANILSERDI